MTGVRPQSGFGDVYPYWGFQKATADDFDALMDDWHWISLFFNRVNRSMGKADLYPFSISDPVVDKLRFIHGVLTDLPRTRVSELDGFGRSIDSQDTAD